jgi:hypothetical protein
LTGVVVRALVAGGEARREAAALRELADRARR